MYIENIHTHYNKYKCIKIDIYTNMFLHIYLPTVLIYVYQQSKYMFIYIYIKYRVNAFIYDSDRVSMSVIYEYLF